MHTNCAGADETLGSLSLVTAALLCEDVQGTILVLLLCAFAVVTGS